MRYSTMLLRRKTNPSLGQTFSCVDESGHAKQYVCIAIEDAGVSLVKLTLVRYEKEPT